jgi:hypothetical protein
MPSSVIGNLTKFLKKVGEDYGTEIDEYGSIDIRIIAVEVDEHHEENENCIALVRNVANGQPYQCTRKKRFGDFCGLHTSKNTQFTAIHQFRKEKKKVYKLSMSRIIETETATATH